MGSIVAGGIANSTTTSVLVNGKPIAVLGDSVTDHGDSPHDSATLVLGSTTVFAGGKPVCRIGDLASCGDSISTGSFNVNAG